MNSQSTPPVLGLFCDQEQVNQAVAQLAGPASRRSRFRSPPREPSLEKTPLPAQAGLPGGKAEPAWAF